jgi:hypothetical protein
LAEPLIYKRYVASSDVNPVSFFLWSNFRNSILFSMFYWTWMAHLFLKRIVIHDKNPCRDNSNYKQSSW